MKYIVDLRSSIIDTVFVVSFLIVSLILKVFTLLELLSSDIDILLVVIHKSPGIVHDLSLKHLSLSLLQHILVLQSELSWRKLRNKLFHVFFGCGELSQVWLLNAEDWKVDLHLLNKLELEYLDDLLTSKEIVQKREIITFQK
jgi:hypothetical protein